MSSGPKTQTVTNQPWQPAQGALTDILGQAEHMYQSGQLAGPGPGQTTQTAQDLISQQARGGSPLLGTAQDTLQQTAAGDFIGANPYLTGMFNQGAGQIQDVVNSQFGRSGRGGSPGHQGVMARELGNFATNLYGGAYQNERENQIRAASMAPMMNQANYYGLGQLANVGAQQDLSALQQSPFGQLQNYLGMAQPIGALGSSSSQPVYGGGAGSVLGGAMAGGGLASMLNSGAAAGAGGAAAGAGGAAAAANPYMWPLMIGGGLAGLL